LGNGGCQLLFGTFLTIRTFIAKFTCKYPPRETVKIFLLALSSRPRMIILTAKNQKEPDYDGDKDRLEVGRRETEEINKQPIKFFEKLLYYWKKYSYYFHNY
jgi:hypothetical protein